jgi:hypothetical protein
MQTNSHPIFEPGSSEQGRSPHRSSRLSEVISSQYLFLFLFIPICGYLLPFVAQKLSLLKPFSETRWDGILDYGYDLQGENADVVIFGDSTATHNINGVQLSRELGLKVINIPGNMPSLPILEDTRLHRYLETNRPPQLIVFYFSRWGMNFTNETPGDTFDGVQQVIRHGSLVDLLHVAYKHPASVLEFPFQFYKASTRMTSLSVWKLKRPIIERGFTPFQIRDMSALNTDCKLPEFVRTHQSTETVSRMAQAFKSDQTRTLIYINPLPECSNMPDIATLDVVGAAPPATLPPDHFASDGSYSHMLPAFTATSTNLLLKAIRDAVTR